MKYSPLIHPFFCPNFDERPLGATLRYIILHATVITPVEAVLDHLCAPENRVSAHYVIDEVGKIFELVPPQKRAWHAGISSWKGEDGLNAASIGIELVNDMVRPYPDIQIQVLMDFLHHLTQAYSIPPSHILGHQDIAPHRKTDPGPHFPWEKLGQAGLGLWPAPCPLEGQGRLDFLHAVGYGPREEEKLSLFEKAFEDHFGEKGALVRFGKGVEI